MTCLSAYPCTNVVPVYTQWEPLLIRPGIGANARRELQYIPFVWNKHTANTKFSHIIFHTFFVSCLFHTGAIHSGANARRAYQCTSNYRAVPMNSKCFIFHMCGANTAVISDLHSIRFTDWSPTSLQSTFFYVDQFDIAECITATVHCLFLTMQTMPTKNTTSLQWCFIQAHVCISLSTANNLARSLFCRQHLHQKVAPFLDTISSRRPYLIPVESCQI